MVLCLPCIVKYPAVIFWIYVLKTRKFAVSPGDVFSTEYSSKYICMVGLRASLGQNFKNYGVTTLSGILMLL